MKIINVFILSTLLCLVTSHLDAQPKPNAKPTAQHAPAPLSAPNARLLAEHLTAHRDAKTRAILKKHAHGQPWCALDFPQERVAHRVRLFANLAYFARTQGQMEQAWTCLAALMDPEGPVYGGRDKMPEVLGLTLEAAILYEAAQVFPHHIAHAPAQKQAQEAKAANVAKESNDTKTPQPPPYKTCRFGRYGENKHTQTYMSCVLDVARDLKGADAFDPEAMQQALLLRSAELVPRASVLAKLTAGTRKELDFQQANWKRMAFIEVIPSTRYADAEAFEKAVRLDMLYGMKPCTSREELQEHNGCVYFELVKSGKARKDASGSWQTHIALARNAAGAVGDTCFQRRWYLTHRRQDASAVQAVHLLDLRNDEICGSGGWGHWSSHGVAHHDVPGRTLTLQESGGAVFKNGGSQLALDHGMAWHQTDIRLICAPTGEKHAFTCLRQSFRTESREDKGSPPRHHRRGFTPRLSFKDGKAALSTAPHQFSYPEYAHLKGLSFAEVVKRLAGINEIIRKRLDIAPPTP